MEATVEVIRAFNLVSLQKQIPNKSIKGSTRRQQQKTTSMTII